MTQTCVSWAMLVLVAALAYAGCGRPKLPAGPPPEYERPEPMPWDAAPAVDPLDAVEEGGGWVDDDPPAELGAAGASAAPPEERDSLER